MVPSQAFTIAVRIINQLIRDRRTVAMIVVVPLVVMSLIGLSFPESSVLDYIAPALLATLALFFSFLLTGISFLRERSQGTLERIMASPVSRLDIVVGYLFGFFLFALTQTIIIILFAIYVLDVHYYGDLWQIFIFPQSPILSPSIISTPFTASIPLANSIPSGMSLGWTIKLPIAVAAASARVADWESTMTASAFP